MAWTTTSAVQDLTGITVSLDGINAAQSVVEMFAGTTEDASDAGNISTKNLRLLGLAVAYQAAWLTQHPDAFTSMDVENATQDGMSFAWAHANAHILAPLAKRAIDRLSWKGNRSILIRKSGDFTGDIPSTNTYTSAVRDDNDPRWRPLY